METIELWPLSQGEIDGAPDGFVDAVFAQGPDLRHSSTERQMRALTRLVAARSGQLLVPGVLGG
jgi:hypothetical protein